MLLAFERLHLLASVRIPDLDGSIATGRYQVLAIEAERQVIDNLFVPLESLENIARREAPELDGLVAATRCKKTTVRAEYDGLDTISRARESSSKEGFPVTAVFSEPETYSLAPS